MAPLLHPDACAIVAPWFDTPPSWPLVVGTQYQIQLEAPETTDCTIDDVAFVFACRGYRQWAYPDSVQRIDPTTFVVTATYGQNTVFDALTADQQRAIIEAEEAAAAAPPPPA